MRSASLFIFLLCSFEIESRLNVHLHGSGASFPASVYNVWKAMYMSHRQNFVDLDMTYESVGSSTGKKLIKGLGEKEVDYAGSDSELTDTELQEYPNLQMIPLLAGAVVLAYNIPGINSLILSREAIVGIYNGTFEYWDAPAIQSTNPNVTLQHMRIKSMARADKSGTTQLFTSALSSFDASWDSEYGVFKEGLNENEEPVHWNKTAIFSFGFLTSGISGMVQATRYSIGYLSHGEAIKLGLSYASIINQRGTAVGPTTEAVNEALASSITKVTQDFTVNLIDTTATFAYPIVGVTYLIVYKSGLESCDTAVELGRYLQWIHEEEGPEYQANRLGMAIIKQDFITTRVNNILKEMTCGNDQNVYELMLEQIDAEEYSLQTWRLPVYVMIPILITIILLFCLYLSYNRYKVNKAIWLEHWKIPKEAIHYLNTRATSASNTSLSLKTGSYMSKVEGKTSTVAMWNGIQICLRKSKLIRQDLKKKTKRQILTFQDLKHPNIVQLMGVTEIDGTMFIASENVFKRCLRDVLQNDKFSINVNLLYAMASDVAKGMAHLHNLNNIHGNLRTTSCYLDGKWNVKVADWEYNALALTQETFSARKTPDEIEAESLNDANVWAALDYWMAPEILEQKYCQEKSRGPIRFTPEGDIYSFGIILLEIFNKEDPFTELTVDKMIEPKEVIQMILEKQLHPTISPEVPKQVEKIMKKAWHVVPTKRPTFQTIVKLLEASTSRGKTSVVECMMQTIESYVTSLESKIEERTQELAVAMTNMEDLLHKILPPTVAAALSKGEPVPPETFDSVSVFFSDIVGFTELSAASAPLQIVTMLNDLYSIFDDIIENYEVYKVETIGDAYLVVSGLPQRNGIQHAKHIAHMALDFSKSANGFTIRHAENKSLQLRAGIHSGPVVAGVVGLKMPRYCLFGDTVNTASRMESTSLAKHIQISEKTYKLLEQLGGFVMEFRGETDIKGKGTLKTYWLHGSSDAQKNIK